MSPSPLQKSARRSTKPLLRLLVLVLATAGVYVPFEVTAAAAPGPVCADAALSEMDAVSLAKACNRAVEVTSRASETMKIVARPDGMLVAQQHLAPVRVRRDNGWVPVDTSLRTLGDGSLQPAASAVDIRFSKGGNDPLVTLNAGGGAVSMSWPAPLPAPSIAADTAVYAEVLPGVDLRVRATAAGFTHVLVVKYAAAADNPDLQTIDYGWSAQGFTVRTRADGGLDFADTAGAVALSAAAGSMWDSSTGAPTGLAAKMLPGNESGPSTDSGSTATGPGDLAKVAAVTVAVTASQLTVTPDQSMLTGPGTVFPLYIDPPVQASKLRWGYANNNGNNRNDGVARVGKNPDGSGAYRSYFEFDVGPFFNKNITEAKFQTTLTHSSPCASTPVSLWATSNMDAGVNGTRTGWAPVMHEWLDEQSGEANSGCGDNPMGMTFANKLAARLRGWVNGNSIMTLGLATYNASGYGEGVDYWKKFDPGSATYLTVWYNMPPSVPAVQPFNSTSDCYLQCQATHPDASWKLNETSGTAAADASLSGRTGNLYGGVSWADGGAKFDGTGDIWYGASLLNTINSFTVSAWAKPGPNSYGVVAAQDNVWRSGFELYHGTNWGANKPCADGNWGATWLDSGVPVDTSKWTHVVLVFDAAAGNTLKLYVDGIFKASGTNCGSGLEAAGAFTIGRSLYNRTAAGRYVGGIDNVQVYQRSVTASDVSTLYSAGRAGGSLTQQAAVVRTTTPTLSATLSDQDGGQMWYEYEVRTAASDSATLLTASGGIGPVGSPTTVNWTVPSGKLVNGSTYYWRIHAVDETGTYYSPWTAWQQVTVDTSPPAIPTAPSTQYPLKAWGAVVGTQGTFTLSDTDTGTAEFEWWVDNGSHTTTTASGSGPRTASVTYTPATDMVHTLYVKAKDNAGNVSTSTYEHQFWVTPTPNRCWLWKLDETSGSTTAADTGKAECAPTDNTIVASNGTATGGVSFGAGYLNNAANFAGTNGQITTTWPVLNTTESFTVMAWVRLDDDAAGDYQTAVSQDGTNVSGFQLQYRKDVNGGAGGWCFTMRASDVAGSLPISACSTTPPTVGQWSHIAGVRDTSTGTIRVYYMGDPNLCSGEMAETAYAATWSAGRAFAIGRSGMGVSGAPADFWKGGVDDVRAYQKVLSEEQICQQASK